MTSFTTAYIRPITAVLAAVALVAGASAAAGQQGRTTTQGEPPNITAGGQTNWTSHNLDLDNSRYSELGEISTETVGGLAERWSYEVAAGIDVGEVTPLVVDGVMYFHAAASVIAVNAVTGEEVWSPRAGRGASQPRPRADLCGREDLLLQRADTGRRRCEDGRARRVVRRRRRPAGGRSGAAGQVPGHLSSDPRSAHARLPDHRPRPRTTTGRSTSAPRSRRGTSRAVS